MGKKILHIVENLDKGAIETWLVRMFHYGQSRGKGLDWTFFCVEGKPGRLDEKVLNLGGKIIYSPVKLSDKISFLKYLRKTLKDEKFDVLHSHHDYMSAFYFIASLGIKLNCRITHIHNSDELIPVKKEKNRKILIFIFRIISLIISDKIVGISKHTLSDFLNGFNYFKHKSTVHYYGFDFNPFIDVKEEREKFRSTYGFNPQNKIILFLSRMDKAKNPIFALNVIKEVIKIDNTVVGLFVGKGNLEHKFKLQVEDYGLLKNIRYIGWSDNVPYIMKNSDLFILPHEKFPMEGLGLVLLEAQAAALPLLVSNGISDDPILSNCNFRKLSLTDDLRKWALEALTLINSKKVDQTQIKSIFEQSPFDMDFALNSLQDLYNCGG